MRRIFFNPLFLFVFLVVAFFLTSIWHESAVGYDSAGAPVHYEERYGFFWQKGIRNSLEQYQETYGFPTVIVVYRDSFGFHRVTYEVGGSETIFKCNP